MLSASDEALCWADMLAVVDSAADGVGNDLEDLVMTPTVAPLPQGFPARAENMFQGPFSLARWTCWYSTIPQMCNLDGVVELSIITIIYNHILIVLTLFI